MLNGLAFGKAISIIRGPSDIENIGVETVARVNMEIAKIGVARCSEALGSFGNGVSFARFVRSAGVRWGVIIRGAAARQRQSESECRKGLF